MLLDLKAKINNQRRIVSRETAKLNQLLAEQRMQNELGCTLIVVRYNPPIPDTMIGMITDGVQGRDPVMAHELDHLQSLIKLTDDLTLSWRCFGWRDEPAPPAIGDLA